MTSTITINTIIKTICFVLLFDLIWIQVCMKNEYKKLIYDIQKSEMYVRFTPAVLSYVTIILSIVMFSLPYIRPSHRLTDSMYYGGMLGLLTYGMFSFTNYALIDRWTVRVAALDTIWGFILYTLVTYYVSSSM